MFTLFSSLVVCIMLGQGSKSNFGLAGCIRACVRVLEVFGSGKSPFLYAFHGEGYCTISPLPVITECCAEQTV